MVLSVLGLSEEINCHLTVAINDKDFDIVLRNFAMLAIALQCAPSQAAEIILQIWYSARITAEASHAIGTYVLPLAEEVAKKIKDKSPKTVFAKTWTFGATNLRLSLMKQEWQAIVSKLAPLSAMTSQLAELNRRAVMLAPERQDYVDRALVTQPERHRQCTMRFRETGILLPFSRDTRAHVVPNP